MDIVLIRDSVADYTKVDLYKLTLIVSIILQQKRRPLNACTCTTFQTLQQNQKWQVLNILKSKPFYYAQMKTDITHHPAGITFTPTHHVSGANA